MADELERNRLEVEKEKTGSRLRRVTSENPEWYRKLCAAHTSRRREGFRRTKHHQTSIKRRETMKALRFIAEGKKPGIPAGESLRRPIYCEWLKPVIRAEIAADKARAKAERASVLEAAPF